MARPLRIQFPGAYYHVTSRGVNRRDIFFDNADREHFLSALGRVYERYGVIFHGWCLMMNHFHLEVQTPRANLSQAMKCN